MNAWKRSVVMAVAAVVSTACDAESHQRGAADAGTGSGGSTARLDAGHDANEHGSRLDAMVDGRTDAGEGDTAFGTLAPDVRDALSALALASIPPPPPDLTNKFADDPRAAHLGQKLFYEPIFSGRLLDGDNDGSEHALGISGDVGKVACAGCHLPNGGFADTRSPNGQISLGAGWVIRRTPSILDVARSPLITWIGRRDALYNQPFGPIESAVEMNSSRLFVAEQISSRYRSEYEGIFGPLPDFTDTKRFPALSAGETGCKGLDSSNACGTPQRGAPGDGAEYDGMSADDQEAVTRVVVNMGKALGAFERQLSCGTSRFDDWARGAAQFTAQEARGAELFVTKGKCVGCHAGPFFSDEKFHNVGLRPEVVETVFIDSGDEGAAAGFAALIADPLNAKGKFSDGDDGRTPTKITATDTGAFRTPKLRCVSARPSFMHTGQLRTLSDVLEFFDSGGDMNGFPGANELVTLGLEPSERDDLVAFLQSLEGAGPPAELRGPPSN